MRKIIENKAQCKKCQDIIQSNTTNDLKRCSCGSIAVDGGLDYVKRLGDLDDIMFSILWHILSIRKNVL